MTDRSPSQPAGPDSRFTRAAALLPMAAPLVWAGILAIEISQAQLSHSLVSRPERLFGAGLGAGLLVLSVCVWLALLVLPLRAFAAHQEHRRIARAALLAAVVALLGRAIVAGAPTDSHLYQVSQLRGAGADVFLVCLPLALVLFAIAGGKRAALFRWLSAAAAIAMVWVALLATQWSVRSGALQPQLWAVEPVEGLGAFWAAAVGAWLFGWPAAVRSRVRPFLRLSAIPSPGRKAAVAIALVGVLGVVAVSADYVNAVGPTITAQLTGRTRVETIRVGDFDRTYRIYRPSQVAAKPGLVIVLHAVFGSGYLAESSTGFDAQADRLGWVVAYPDGVLDGWDAFGDTPYWGRHPGVDDVAFAGALIDRLSASDRLDPDRIYVTGFSRGAMMTYRLGCELSGRVAAIAPVSGNMATADGSADGVPCQLNAPVSVLAIHGTADGSIPIAGGQRDIAYAPMTDVIARWRQLDSCAAAATVSADGASTTTSWACGGATVAARVVSGGVHAWPGAVAPPYQTSAEADAFDAARLIADFFAAHPRVRT
ncbi:MAG TPA: PHB depolymerase family esterase [Candidatus Limnocylindrales bacterium]